MSSCEYYQEMISRMIDDDLSEEERAVLARHLDTCPECSALYTAFSDISAAISDALAEPPKDLTDNIMAKLRRADIKAKNPRKPRWRGMLATAACLAVVIMAAWFIPNMFRAGSASTAASDMAAPAAVEYAMEEDTAAGEGTVEAAAAEEPAEVMPESEARVHKEGAEAEIGSTSLFTATSDEEDNFYDGIYIELSGDRAAQFVAGLYGEEDSLPEAQEAEASYEVCYELDGKMLYAFIRVYDGRIYYSFDNTIFYLSSWEKTEIDALFFQN